MDELFHWQLHLTFRKYLLCLVGVPVIAIAILAIRRIFVFNDEQTSPWWHLLLLAIPSAPAILFLLLSTNGRKEQTYLLTASFLLVISLTLLLFFLRRRHGPTGLDASAHQRRTLIYITIAVSLATCMLAMAYPWIGSSVFAWPMLATLALPSILAIWSAAKDPEPAANEANVAQNAFPMLLLAMLPLFPTLTIPWWVLAIIGLLLLAISTLFIVRGKTPKSWRLIPFGVAMAMILLAVGRKDQMKTTPASDFQEIYLRSMAKMDTVDADTFYQQFLVPEQERASLLLGKIDHINLLAEQDYPEMGMLYPEVERLENHLDPELQLEIRRLIDSTISRVRRDAMLRVKWAPTANLPDTLYDSFSQVYNQYFSLPPRSIWESTFEEKHSLSTILQARIDSLKGLSKTEREKNSLFALENMRRQMQAYESQTADSRVTEKEFYTDLLYRFETALDVQFLKNYLNESIMVIDDKGVQHPLMDYPATNNTLRHHLDTLVAAYLTKPITKVENAGLERLSLKLPLQQIDGLMYLALQPRNKSLLHWQEKYVTYLEKFAKLLFLRPAAKSRVEDGPMIVAHVRKLIIYHISLLAILVLVAVFYVKKDGFTFWQFLPFSFSIILLVWLFTFDLGLENMLDIEHARHSSIFPGWQLGSRDSSMLATGNNSLNSEEEILRELRLIREELERGCRCGDAGGFGPTDLYHLKKEQELNQ